MQAAKKISGTAADTFTVLLKLNPAPRNLSESRAIHRVVQAAFGRLWLFKEHRFTNKNHNYIITVLPNKAAYDRALSSSPIYINTSNSESRVSSSSRLPPLTDGPPESWKKGKRFRCDIQPSSFDHEGSMKKNPFWGPWEIQRGNITYQTLRLEGCPGKAEADFQLEDRSPIWAKKKDFYYEQGSVGDVGLMGAWRTAMGLNTDQVTKNIIRKQPTQDEEQNHETEQQPYLQTPSGFGSFAQDFDRLNMAPAAKTNDMDILEEPEMPQSSISTTSAELSSDDLEGDKVHPDAAKDKLADVHTRNQPFKSAPKSLSDEWSIYDPDGLEDHSTREEDNDR